MSVQFIKDRTMTLTIISTDSIGPGTQITYLANNDRFFIREGVMVASTTASPIAGGNLTGISLTIAGDMVAPSLVTFSGINADVTILQTGTFTSYNPDSGSAGLFLSAAGATFTNYGSFVAPDSIGVLARAAAGTMTNYGSMVAASPMFIFLAAGTNVVNGGTLTATNRNDDTATNRYNNGVFVDESINVNVTNLATGIITAAGLEGAGVNFGANSGGGWLNNSGIIESLQDYGVRLSLATLGQAELRVQNFGTITGFDGSFLGSVNADALVNRKRRLRTIDLRYS